MIGCNNKDHLFSNTVSLLLHLSPDNPIEAITECTAPFGVRTLFIRQISEHSKDPMLIFLFRSMNDITSAELSFMRASVMCALNFLSSYSMDRESKISRILLTSDPNISSGEDPAHTTRGLLSSGNAPTPFRSIMKGSHPMSKFIFSDRSFIFLISTSPRNCSVRCDSFETVTLGILRNSFFRLPMTGNSGTVMEMKALIFSTAEYRWQRIQC